MTKETPDEEPFAGYSTEQVRKELDLTPGRVRQLARWKGIGMKVGRDWRFTRADIEALRKLIRPKKQRN